MSIHEIVDSEWPSIQADFERSAKRQRSRFMSDGRLIVTDFNPAKKLTRTMKRTIKEALRWQADDAAEEWAAQHGLRLARSIDSDSRRAIGGLLRKLKDGGMEPGDIHRRIGQIIGLTDRQANTLAGLTGLSSSQVEARANQLLESRGKILAHNETMLAANMGLQVAYEEGLKQGTVRSNSRKVWRTENDSRVCNICEPLNRKQAPIRGVFKTGLKTPPAHPGCRCYMTLNLSST